MTKLPHSYHSVFRLPPSALRFQHVSFSAFQLLPEQISAFQLFRVSAPRPSDFSISVFQYFSFCLFEFQHFSFQHFSFSLRPAPPLFPPKFPIHDSHKKGQKELD